MDAREREGRVRDLGVDLEERERIEALEAEQAREKMLKTGHDVDVVKKKKITDPETGLVHIETTEIRVPATIM